MKFKFEASVIIEASNEEDALAKISGRISVVQRHIGNGASLAENEPFFSLTAVPDITEAEVISIDPIRAAQIEQQAAEAAAAEEQNPAETETEPSSEDQPQG